MTNLVRCEYCGQVYHKSELSCPHCLAPLPDEASPTRYTFGDWLDEQLDEQEQRREELDERLEELRERVAALDKEDCEDVRPVVVQEDKSVTDDMAAAIGLLAVWLVIMVLGAVCVALGEVRIAALLIGIDPVILFVIRLYVG